ncbi:MAG: cytochrome c-type biogenesis protein CcmH [Candidatus Actinomarina sp.]|jgi:cytochrome c-type biogenesis protein CcmH|nr:cytochrome c-type biogenesis protein CcmH [Candidatus Actinomarina sp.]MDB2326799.1 cytochrome c-type biogenesis protein CcmH [Candidatus Actinomarina sp.]MDB4823588.1 cytochrome c-type biogenesis protein CcmH [Acidimicrobiia bacterium]
MKNKYIFVSLILTLVLLPFLYENDESRFETWSKNLLCPVCQGETIFDSPSEYADDMRFVLKEQINNNLSDQEIYDYWVSRFGERIITNPQNKNIEIIIIPLLISVIFIIFFVRKVKK